MTNQELYHYIYETLQRQKDHSLELIDYWMGVDTPKGKKQAKIAKESLARIEEELYYLSISNTENFVDQMYWSGHRVFEKYLYLLKK